MATTTTDEPWKPFVAYWLVEQLQRSRDEFRIIAIFNEEAAANKYMEENNNQKQHHPMFVNGVISFEQLVDVLIAERFFPFSAFGTKAGKDLIFEAVRDEVRKCTARA